jgi:4-hydroxymandelate oxidase
MTMTRREAVIRGVSGMSAFAVGTHGKPIAQDDQGRAIPAGVVTLEDFEALARQRLSPTTFEGVRSGGADEITLRWNRDSFNRIPLRPRVLVDVSNLSTSVTLFGQTLPFPILLAPAGVHGMLHPDAELETARGATRSRTVLVIPSTPSRPVEDVSRATEGSAWYQLYIRSDRPASRDEAQRAERAGCRVLVVTVDGAAPGVRNVIMRPPFRPTATPGELQTIVDTKLSWKDIAWLRSLVKIPIVLKGILDPRDAERAVAEGVDGIIVSNHGGRQLDSAAATIDALPAIADTVRRRIPVLLDGGVRRGTDVLKALARGASAVLIGRPFLYGLGTAGAEGVHRVVSILREEFEIAMKLTGRASLADIDRSVLWSADDKDTLR